MNGRQIILLTNDGRGSDSARRMLGLFGIIGGALLLAAFLVPISLNSVRLVAFNVGAIAVAANAWYAVMVLLSLGVEHPFAGDFGLVFFLAGAAMWLSDAGFGAAVLSIAHGDRGVKLAGFALLVGSLLAFAGPDRLGLTGQGRETLFTPVSLAGIFLNGCSWILLGWRLLRGSVVRARDHSR